MTQMTETNELAWQGKLQLHSARALSLFAKGKPGDTISVDKMTEVVGRDCSTKGKGRANVTTAIKACERDRGIVWRWSRDIQAWLCLDNKQCVHESTRGISGGFRKVNRALRVAATVNPVGLDDDTRREHTLNIAIAGAMRVMGHGGTRKRLEPHADRLSEPDIGKVLKLMQK